MKATLHAHWTAVLVVAALATGCAPKVKLFRVVKAPAPGHDAAGTEAAGAALPLRLCAPGPVSLSWEVAGRATLAAVPPAAATCDPLAANGHVPAKGTTTCTINASTTLKMHAGPSAAAPAWWRWNEGISDVTVGPTQGALGAQAECVPAGYESYVTRDPLQWDAGFRVTRIAVAGQLRERLRSQPGLALRISHRGLEDHLDGDHPSSDRLRCVPYGGDWILTLPTSPGTSCAEDPVFLSVEVDTACGPCPPAP